MPARDLRDARRLPVSTQLFDLAAAARLATPAACDRMDDAEPIAHQTTNTPGGEDGFDDHRQRRWSRWRPIAAVSIGMGSGAQAQDKLKVIVFPGLSNLAQFAAESQGYLQEAQSRGRADQHAELRRAAQRAGRGPLRHRAWRRRQRGGAGRERQDRPVHLHGRQSRAQQPVRAARDQIVRTAARHHHGGRRAEHRVRAAALQDARRERHQAQRLQGRSRSARRICGSRRC